MCGILFTNKKNITKKSFIDALKLMTHRGPDSIDTMWVDENIKLGHTRLSIIDLDKRSNQPFCSQNGRYVIIFNGEIYNYEEIAKEYKINLNTKSDTEVLIELYAILGEDMLHQLNGMFSIVIYDLIKKDVFVARDRLGIKPLYYFLNDKEIIVSSEIAPILKMCKYVDIDEIGLRQYKKLRTFFNGHTLYKNIGMFKAGTFLKSGRIKTYWSLQEKETKPPTYDELRFLIESAVRYRCISDVPIGSYLSGGLDSTIITGISGTNDTWTVGFKDNNEFKWSELAAKKFNSSHNIVLTNKEEYIETLEWMVKKRREPLSVPNEVLIYLMTKKLKEKNTVVLSGEGADELFFGYDRIFNWASNSKWDLKEFDKHYSYGSHDDLEILEYALEEHYHHRSAIDIVGSFFQISHLHGLLRRLDNSSMLCSVEARVPFVDHRLIDRMYKVPYEYRIKKGISKYPLKEIFKDIVPSDIINREKVGFPVPLDSIFSGQKDKSTIMDEWFNFNLNLLLN